jgi:hypothetical protein
LLEPTDPKSARVALFTVNLSAYRCSYLYLG